MPEQAVAAQDHPRTKVFVSYARVDAAFADLVVEGLNACGFDPLIDRSAIEHGEDWWARIVELITDSAAVVFLISPQSVAPNSVCGRELALIRKLNLRIVPVLFRFPTASADMPGDLASKDWIQCDEYGRRCEHATAAAIALKVAFANGAPTIEIERLEAELKSAVEAFRAEMAADSSWQERVSALERALSLDEILWRREASSWLARARAWDDKDRPANLAMRPGEIAALRAWSNRRPANAVMPEAIQAYLETSEAYERDQTDERRRIIGRAFVKPARRALEEGRCDAALRLSAAGTLLGEDAEMTLVPQRDTEGLFRRAAFEDRTRAVLLGHRGLVRTAAFSPDGARVITASDDNTARIWNAVTGAEIACLQGHANIVRTAAFSPDGTCILTASWDRTAQLWDAATGAKLARLEGHKSYVNAATFSADGRRVVTASLDHTARVWDAVTGDATVHLQGHQDNVVTAAFSADGARIVTASPDKTVRVWDAASGTEIARLQGHEHAVLTACFNTDDTRIVTASADNTARIWDAVTGAEIACLRGHEKSVNTAVFSADGARAVTASWDATARVWDAVSGAEISCLRGHDGAIATAAFSPDGARVATASWDATARIWDADSGGEIACLRGHEGNWVNTATFSPDGTRIVTASMDGSARVWDAAAGVEIARFHSEAVAISAEGSRIAAASSNNTVRVWDAAGSVVISLLEDEVQQSISHLAFSADGTRLISIGGAGAIAVWDVATGAVTGRKKGASIHLLACSADGGRILLSSGDNTGSVYLWVWDPEKGTDTTSQSRFQDRITAAAMSPNGERFTVSWLAPVMVLYDVITGKEIAQLGGHEAEILSAAFSADGARIVTTSRDKTARIWNAKTGAEIACLRGHQDTLVSAAFSVDGARVVTASHDKTARIWDAVAGAEIARLEGHEGWVHAASFSVDGARVVTTSWDKTVRIWDASSGGEIARLPGHEDQVIEAAISADGARIITKAWKTAHVWDGMRTSALAGAPAAVLAASLMAGRGVRTPSEREDLLMQPAPDNLHAALIATLSEADQKEASRRAQILALPSHTNCYLTPSFRPVWQAAPETTVAPEQLEPARLECSHEGIPGENLGRSGSP